MSNMKKSKADSIYNKVINKDTIRYEELLVKPQFMTICESVIPIVLFGAMAIFCLVNSSKSNDNLLCGIGLIIICIYVGFIAFPFQKSSSYSFEFMEGAGLQKMKVFYKGKELELKYKLDKTGRFMWEDNRRRAACIAYADGSSMNSWFVKYRVLNYMNGFLSQNHLMSKEIY